MFVKGSNIYIKSMKHIKIEKSFCSNKNYCGIKKSIFSILLINKDVEQNDL